MTKREAQAVGVIIGAFLIVGTVDHQVFEAEAKMQAERRLESFRPPCDEWHMTQREGEAWQMRLCKREGRRTVAR